MVDINKQLVYPEYQILNVFLYSYILEWIKEIKIML